MAVLAGYLANRPQADAVVAGAGDQHRTRGIEIKRQNRLQMGIQGDQLPRRLYFPDSDHVVAAPASQQSAIRRECQSVYPAGMSDPAARRSFPPPSATGESSSLCWLSPGVRHPVAWRDPGSQSSCSPCRVLLKPARTAQDRTVLSRLAESRRSPVRSKASAVIWSL